MARAPVIISNHWFNSKPLTKRDLGGKIVLVDFWTYTCVNCLRTIPYLKEWWRKYAGKNFIQIGVHTPEFHFEKDVQKVEAAIKGLGIEWPIALDNDYVNWNNYANRYWPAKYLVNQDGQIVYYHFGEGNYEETESFIQDLILEKNVDVKLPGLTGEKVQNVCVRATPETYCGYNRGEIANESGYVHDSVYDYRLPDFWFEDRVALDGLFIARTEYVETRETGATIVLDFQATDVNLVLEPVGSSSRVKIMFDEEDLGYDIRGEDVNDESILTIKSARMYNLIKQSRVLHGSLRIEAVDGFFRAYAFTFSSCL